MTINTETNRCLCYNYHGSGVPFWQNPTTISVAWIAERDQGNTTDLVNTSSTTLTTTTSGANGILVSANLAGTVSNSANSTTITGSGTSFTSSFIVGDVIYINSTTYATITAISSNTSLTVSQTITSANTNVSYSRGGRATLTWYYLYVIAKAGGSNVSLALSTRAVNNGDTLVDLPAGYTLYRQLPFAIPTDTAANLNAFRVGSGWPYTPIVYYDTPNTPSAANNQLFSASITPAGTTYSCSAPCLVPTKVAQIVLLNCHNLSNSTDSGLMVQSSSGSSYSGQISSDCYYSSVHQVRVLIGSGGSVFFYMTNGTTSTRTAYVTGYIITLVP
jgi:hypothetical protein